MTNQHKRQQLLSLKLGFSVFIGALALTGCQADIDALADVANDVKEHFSSESSNGHCQSTAKPFVHSLCEVSQDSLTDNSLSLRLFWKSGQDDTADADTNQALSPLFKFDALLNDLPDDKELLFAANAGMYDSNFAPIGYTVMQGKQVLSLNLNEGGGNFHMTPNGVLWWDQNNQVHITESHALAKQLQNGSAKPWYATQSGPMLVIDGKLHPKFNQDSRSLKIRNGVGVCSDGKIKFVTSTEPVNFYEFASFFKDSLNCPNALFLDGGIASAVYAPDIHKKDDKNMGVMVGLVKKQRL